MELRHIKYLLAVADHQNFTRAAEALHISQPTLSQQIKQLEHAVGVKLFDRSGRTVRLTDAGSAYVHHARLAVRDLEAAERAVHDVRDLSRGNLRIAVTPTFTAYLIGQLIYSYREAYPGIRVTVLETNQDKMEADLLADRLDLGIGFAGPHAAGIEARTLFAETLVLVVGSGHPLETGAVRVPVAELAGEPLGLLSSDFTRLHVDAYFAECQVPQNIAIEANSVSALLELVGRASSPPCCRMRSPVNAPTCTRSRWIHRCRPAPCRCCSVPASTSPQRRAFAAMLDAMVAERRS
ncbi:transcription regulator LysR family protein [Mycolicibacter terrae]|uniref:Probable hydrogen peroxide-inducible genes activator n=1 Tax=Mycolicibacter terrae TaxID=1788 RepID=A0AAD1I1Q0_9MYCO|nr:transcription regulator LysR family protein [Mycolicibacter terrae]